MLGQRPVGMLSDLGLEVVVVVRGQLAWAARWSPRGEIPGRGHLVPPAAECASTDAYGAFDLN
jgi:hypothetical protein